MIWHKELVAKIKHETGCTHEQAMNVLGFVCEITESIYCNAYGKGYNNGFNNSITNKKGE